MSIVNRFRFALEGDGRFKKTLRQFGKLVLQKVYRKGYPVKLGGLYTVRMDVAFVRFENFGDRHNSGWRPCLEACKGESVFFDIGAHIGLYSLPASIVMGSWGKVYAFEPARQNYSTLLRHVQLNRATNICVYNCLIGDRDSEVTFYEDPLDANPMNSLTLLKEPERYVPRKVKQLTLDTFCRDENVVPDVIKIDVEGAELYVLEGAQEVLMKHRPLIFLSVHPRHIQQLGYSLDRLCDQIDSLHYEVRNTDNSPIEGLGSGEYMIIPKSEG